MESIRLANRTAGGVSVRGNEEAVLLQRRSLVQAVWTLQERYGNRLFQSKISQNFPPDWRGRFAEAYRRELQTWVDAILRWRLGDVESEAGPVDGPDAWDGYRAAVTSQAVLASMSEGGPARVESISLPEFHRRCRTSSS